MRKVLKSSHYESKPWKNGLGTTQEIIVWPEGSADSFDWRISLADLKVSGPFSLYPGIDRILVILEGQEVILTQNGRTFPLPLMTPFAFEGSLATSARVKAVGRDFNLMLRQGKFHGKISLMSGMNIFPIPSKYIGIFSTREFLVDGEALEANDFVLFSDEKDRSISVTGPGEYLVIEINERNL